LDQTYLQAKDPRLGVLGHNRKISIDEIWDGNSNTMFLFESGRNGPWVAGGQHTVRGFNPDEPLYGKDAQLFGFHRCAVVGMGDGAVRRFKANMSPALFAALATIAGNESIDELPP
jgi:hypothetical protein